MISKYIRLLRPIAWITFLLPFSVGLGLGITQKSLPYNILFAFLAFISWMSFSFILNAIADRNVDKLHDGRSKDMNLARQPIATGEISLKKAYLISIIFLFLSLIFAWYINIFFFVLICIVNFIGYIYSMPPLRLKTKPIGDILCNAFAGVGIFIAGLSINKVFFDLMIVLGSFTLAAVFYIPTVLTDFEFDTIAGLKTSAVFFGPKKILQIMAILLLLNIIIWFFVYLNSNIEYRVLAIISIAYSIIFTTITNLRLKDEKLTLHENWILIPFPIISFIFILYGILKLVGWILI